MELARGLIIPVWADSVLSPDFYYGDYTGIYFETTDDESGRITFSNLDAVKICRGENLPFADDWQEDEELPWVYRVENSRWLRERYDYEHRNYGSAYEFGGNAGEMLTDFSHYIFQFHNQYIEVIARGFWFEKSAETLFRRELTSGHPLLPLPETDVALVEIEGLRVQTRFNPLPIKELVENAAFCPQKLMAFAVGFEDGYSVIQTLGIAQQQGQIISTLRGYFGRPTFERAGVALLTDVWPLVEQEVRKIAARRQKMRKQ